MESFAVQLNSWLVGLFLAFIGWNWQLGIFANSLADAGVVQMILVTLKSLNPTKPPQP